MKSINQALSDTAQIKSPVHFSQTSRHLIYLFIWTLIYILPLLAQSGVLNAPDTEFHLYNMRLFGKEIQNGILYPRWLGDWFWGYGTALPIYYQSFPYLLGGFLINIGISAVLALKLTVWVAMLGMGWFMYYFSRQFLPAAGALLAAIFYQTTPFFLLSLYINMTLPSYIALFWLPLLLLLIIHCAQRSSITWIILLGLAFAGVIMTHLLVAIMMSPAMVIFGIYMLYQQQNRGAAFVRLAAGGILGMILSSVYLLPSVFENQLLYVDWYIHGNNWSNYQNNFLFSMPFTGADMGLTLAANTIVGIGSILNIILVTLVTGYYLRNNPAADSKRRSVALVIAGIFAFTTFMAYKPSEPIYELITSLSLLQFPWRWQAISGLAAAYIAGEGFSLLIEFNTNIRTRITRLYSYTTMGIIAVTIAFGSIIIYIAVVMFGPMPADHLTNILSDNPTESTFFHRNFLPATAAQIDFDALQEPHPRVSTNPAAEIDIQQWTSPQRVFTIQAESETQVKIHTFNFPGWAVMLNGEEITDLQTAPDDSTMVFTIPAGQTQVTASFGPTPLRRLGEVLSLLSVVLCAITLLWIGVRQRTSAV